jgi:surfactin synthase thioesterase subunit
MADEATPLTTLLQLLQELNLDHLRAPLASETLASLSALLDNGRPALLAHMKAAGVERLPDRQALANKYSAAKRSGRLQLGTDADVPPGPPDVSDAVTVPTPTTVEAVEPAQPGSGPPLLVSFYSGGLTAADGRKMLRRWTAAAKLAGFEDALVLDGPMEFESECTVFDDYVSRLEAQVSAAAGAERPVLLVGHSRGAMAAFGLAQRLGSRVRCLYVVACRPPLPPDGAFGLNETWGVGASGEGRAALRALGDEGVLRGLLAWENEMMTSWLEKPRASWPATVAATVERIRREYSSEVLAGMPLAPLGVPIVGVAASNERPLGETRQKMEGWRQMTGAAFELQTIEGRGHFNILQPTVARGGMRTPLYDILLCHMTGRPAGTYMHCKV